jgi:hypothetical protein
MTVSPGRRQTASRKARQVPAPQRPEGRLPRLPSRILKAQVRRRRRCAQLCERRAHDRRFRATDGRPLARPVGDLHRQLDGVVYQKYLGPNRRHCRCDDTFDPDASGPHFLTLSRPATELAVPTTAGACHFRAVSRVDRISGKTGRPTCPESVIFHHSAKEVSR